MDDYGSQYLNHDDDSNNICTTNTNNRLVVRYYDEKNNIEEIFASSVRFNTDNNIALITTLEKLYKIDIKKLIKIKARKD